MTVNVSTGVRCDWLCQTVLSNKNNKIIKLKINVEKAKKELPVQYIGKVPSFMGTRDS